MIEITARLSSRGTAILGAISIAGGTVGVVSAVSHGWSRTGLALAGVFWLAAGLAFLGWAGMKLWSQIRPPPTGWSVRLFHQRALAATVAFLAVAAFFGPEILLPEARYVVWMKEDLRNLVAAQDAFFADSGY